MANPDLSDLEAEALALESRNKTPLSRLTMSEAMAVVRFVRSIDAATIQALAAEMAEAKAKREADLEKQRNRFRPVVQADASA